MGKTNRVKKEFTENQINEFRSIAEELGEPAEDIIEVAELFSDLLDEGVVIETDCCKCFKHQLNKNNSNK